MLLKRVLEQSQLEENWWSKCHSVENSRGVFVLFSDNYYPKPLQGQTGQGFIFRHL